MTVPPSRTALLVMDVQHGIVDRIDDADVLLERLAAALDAGRGAGATVVYVKIGFRAGHPEISPRNRTFSEKVFPRQAEVTTAAEVGSA